LPAMVLLVDPLKYMPWVLSVTLLRDTVLSFDVRSSSMAQSVFEEKLLPTILLLFEETSQSTPSRLLEKSLPVMVLYDAVLIKMPLLLFEMVLLHTLVLLDDTNINMPWVLFVILLSVIVLFDECQR
jgi:hypothetical protein